MQEDKERLLDDEVAYSDLAHERSDAVENSGGPLDFHGSNGSRTRYCCQLVDRRRSRGAEWSIPKAN